ncbi:MAG: hypothetical protein P1V97_22690 [Planctomycetota bacterium]|nr:hypothetical protein [Planctomycetota bacterium]
MDWKSIWHTHKVFIRNVGIGTAVYLVLLSYTQSLAVDAQNLSRRNTAEARKLKKIESDLERVEGKEKGRENYSKELEDDVLQRILWKLSPEKTVKKSVKNRYLDFARIRAKTIKAINEKSLERGKGELLPRDFGFISSKDDVHKVDEHCYRLDITERVLVFLYENETDSRLRPNVRIEQKKANFEKLPAKDGTDRYLGQIPIRFTMTISPSVFPGLLAEFQREGQFLEVTEFSQKRDGRSKTGHVSLVFTVSAMITVNKLPKGNKVKKRRGGGSSARFGRRYRRRR